MEEALTSFFDEGEMNWGNLVGLSDRFLLLGLVVFANEPASVAFVIGYHY